MANICENDLRITGFKNENEVEEFKKKARNKKESFQLYKFIPPPIGLKFKLNNESDENLIKKYGATNQVDWKIKNWGIKYDIYDTDLYDEDSNHLKYQFGSPWCPPVEGIQKISILHPHLIFVLKYEENGEGVTGVVKCINGNIKEYKMNLYDEDL